MKKKLSLIMNFRPILFLAVGVCLGIFTAYLFCLSRITEGIVLTSLSIIIPIIFVIIYRKSNSRRNLVFLLLFFVFFGLSFFNFQVRFNNFTNQEIGDRNYTVNARVERYGKVSSGNKYILDNLNFVGEENGKSSYKMALYLYGESNLDVGDNISFTAFIEDVSAISEGSLSTYELEDGIRYSCSISSSEITVLNNSKTVFESINVAIREGLKEGLKEENFPIAYALLTGNSADMDSELLVNFRSAGVAHIFAVSGLHIGFVSGILFFIFKRIKISKVFKLIIVGAVLIFYSGICLFTASAIRATIMCITVMLADCLGLKYDSVSSLSLSAIVVLILSPTQLFCAGFGLSFGIVLGILMFNGVLKKAFFFLPEKMATLLSVSISAQITAIPISLIFFNNFSVISILINVIFVPFVSLLFTVLIISLAIGGIFGILPIVLYPCSLALDLVRLLIGSFDYNAFLFGGIALGGGGLIYFIILLILSGAVNVKGVLKAVAVILMVISLIGEVAFVNVRNYQSLRITAIGSTEICSTLVSDNGSTSLIVNDTENYFNVYRIKRVAESYGGRVDSFIFPSGEGLDISNVITKLLSVCKTDKIYFSKDRTALSAHQLRRVFSNIEFEEITERTEIELGKSKITLSAKLRLCEISRNFNGKIYSVGVLSSISESLDSFLELANFNFDVVICRDQMEKVNKISGAKCVVSYLSHKVYANAQTNGNYRIMKFR